MNITVTLFAQMVAFILLLYFVNKVLWKPMSSMLDARQKRITDGLAAAEEGVKAQEVAEKNAAEALAEAKQQAANIIATAQKRSTEIIEEAKQTAQSEATKLLTGAKAEIDQEANRAREHLRKEVAGIAVAGARKILQKEIDSQAHAGLMQELASQI